MEIVFRRTPGLIYDVYQALTMKLNDRNNWIRRLGDGENKEKIIIDMDYCLNQLQDPNPELAVFFKQKDEKSTNFFYEIFLTIMQESDETVTQDSFTEYLKQEDRIKNELCQYYLGCEVDYTDMHCLTQAIINTPEMDEQSKFLLLSFFINDGRYLEELREIFATYCEAMEHFYEARANALLIKQEHFCAEEACAGLKQELPIRKRGRKKEIQKCVVSFVLFNENAYWSLSKNEEEVWFIIGDQYVEPVERATIQKVDMEKFGNALGDKNRIKIINIILTEGEKSSAEIAARLNIALNTVGYHLEIMKKANLLCSRNQGKTAYYWLNIPVCHMAAWELHQWVLGENL